MAKAYMYYGLSNGWIPIAHALDRVELVADLGSTFLPTDPRCSYPVLVCREGRVSSSWNVAIARS